MPRDTDETVTTRNFTVAAQIIAWLVGVLLAYGALSTRVAVTENNVSRLQSDVQEIKTDVKTLLLRK